MTKFLTLWLEGEFNDDFWESLPELPDLMSEDIPDRFTLRVRKERPLLLLTEPWSSCRSMRSANES